MSSGSSSGGGWLNVKVPSSDDMPAHGDLDVPFYGRHPEDSLDSIDLKPISPTQGREDSGDTDEEDGPEHEGEGEGKAGRRREGHGGDRKDRKTYSFVSLPGNAVRKRPRRRYDEIERLYQCK